MKYPCIFKTPFMREQVNPRLYAADPKVPLGAFTRAWRQLHCPLVNPYGADCPYDPEDCAIAYLKVATDALDAKTSKVGLFRILAKRAGIDRADSKPLARDRYSRTYGHQSGATDLRAGPVAGPAHDLGHGGRGEPRVPDEPRLLPVDRSVGLRREDHRPQHLGDLLRGDGAGPRTHPYRRHEGEASGDHDGDARDPVSPPSPRRLGDQPPSGDPDLHKGSQ